MARLFDGGVRKTQEATNPRTDLKVGHYIARDDLEAETDWAEGG